MLVDRWFARTYGWTPDQVSELPLEDYEWLPVVEQAWMRVEQLLHQREQRMASVNGRQ